LYSATGRARRRKWRYIKYTPLPFYWASTAHWVPQHSCWVVSWQHKIMHVYAKICVPFVKKKKKKKK